MGIVKRRAAANAKMATSHLNLGDKRAYMGPTHGSSTSYASSFLPFRGGKDSTAFKVQRPGPVVENFPGQRQPLYVHT